MPARGSVRMNASVVPSSWPMAQIGVRLGRLAHHQIERDGSEGASAVGRRVRHQKRAGLATIFLDASGAQAGQAVLVDGPLPAQEFIDRERIAFAGFLEAD
jgi:hypothetical protein